LGWVVVVAVADTYEVTVLVFGQEDVLGTQGIGRTCLGDEFGMPQSTVTVLVEEESTESI
jgi:hypothetical protein